MLQTLVFKRQWLTIFALFCLIWAVGCGSKDRGGQKPAQSNPPPATPAPAHSEGGFNGGGGDQVVRQSTAKEVRAIIALLKQILPQQLKIIREHLPFIGDTELRAILTKIHTKDLERMNFEAKDQGACVGASGSEADSALTADTICFSVSRLMTIPRQALPAQLSALTFYQLARRHLGNHTLAGKVQRYILDEVNTGRAETKSLILKSSADVVRRLKALSIPAGSREVICKKIDSIDQFVEEKDDLVEGLSKLDYSNSSPNDDLHFLGLDLAPTKKILDQPVKAATEKVEALRLKLCEEKTRKPEEIAAEMTELSQEFQRLDSELRALLIDPPRPNNPQVIAENSIVRESSAEDVRIALNKLRGTFFMHSQFIKVPWDLPAIRDAELKAILTKILEGHEENWDPISFPPTWGSGQKDFAATELQFKDEGPCLTQDGHPSDASVAALTLRAPICFSVSRLRSIPKEALIPQISALAAHEVAHHFGANEQVAAKVQKYFLDELWSGKAYWRLRFRFRFGYAVEGFKAAASGRAKEKEICAGLERGVKFLKLNLDVMSQGTVLPAFLQNAEAGGVDSEALRSFAKGAPTQLLERAQKVNAGYCQLKNVYSGDLSKEASSLAKQVEALSEQTLEILAVGGS